MIQRYSPPNESPERVIHPVLKGQKALVTGASKGLGAGIAACLAEAGCDVLVNYSKDLKGVEETASKVTSFGRIAHIQQADVSKEAEVMAMFDTMRERFGRIDILIDNSGIQSNAPFDEMTLQQWNEVMASISPVSSSAHGRR